MEFRSGRFGKGALEIGSVIALLVFSGHNASAKMIGAGSYIRACRIWQESAAKFTSATMRDIATNACKNFVADTLHANKENAGCFLSKVACSVELQRLFKAKIQEACPPIAACRAAKPYYDSGATTSIVEDPLPADTWFCERDASGEAHPLDGVVQEYFGSYAAPTQEQLIAALRSSNLDPPLIAHLEGVVVRCVPKKILDDLAKSCSCGNGEIETAYGETCDTGADNGAPSSACSAQCKTAAEQLAAPVTAPTNMYYDFIKKTLPTEMVAPTLEPAEPNE